MIYALPALDLRCLVGRFRFGKNFSIIESDRGDPQNTHKSQQITLVWLFPSPFTANSNQIAINKCKIFNILFECRSLAMNRLNPFRCENVVKTNVVPQLHVMVALKSN